MQSNLFQPKAEPIILRPYQAEAVQAVYGHLRSRDDNPVVVIPTGGGKTPVIATICRDAVTQWNGRVLVLAHVKELLQQSADKLSRVCPDVQVGVYSAGLNRRDKRQSVIVAGIQSVYSKACELDAFDLVLIDEAHLIPPDGDGMYRQFLTDAKTVNPNLRIIGLTATPFRLKSGPICTSDGYLNSICYEIGVKQLIVDGFLSPLSTRAGRSQADFGSIAIRGGEFVAGDMEKAMDVDELVRSAVTEIAAATLQRRATLLFCSGIEHGQHVVEMFRHLGIACGFVSGDTPDGERARTLEKFQTGDLRYLANVNVLTTGFDAPHIDCVCLLRPTMSPGLYYQMVGRGFRLSPGKTDCLVLDFGGNVLRHGPVDLLKVKDVAPKSGAPGEPVAKECPECHELIATAYAACPSCGHLFPPPERSKHDGTASSAGILSGEVTLDEYEVEDMQYSVHVKRGASPDTPRTLRVDYCVGDNRWKSEWICIEHEGWARQKAEAWWAARSTMECPTDAYTAAEIGTAGGLAECIGITVRSVTGEKYDRIVDYKLGERAEPLELQPSLSEEEEIPF